MLTADRVKETTTTTGTGDVTLAGAASGFRTINAALGLNVWFCYFIIAANGTDWEEGSGYLSGATTLVRSMVNRSTNSNNAINLAAGTHTVLVSVCEGQINQQHGRVAAAGLRLTATAFASQF